jgi:hypothetical protein
MTDAKGMLVYAIILSLSLLVVAYTIPMGLQAISNANLTGVNAVVAQFFTVVLPIMVVCSLAIGFMPPEIKTKVGI